MCRCYVFVGVFLFIAVICKNFSPDQWGIVTKIVTKTKQTCKNPLAGGHWQNFKINHEPGNFTKKVVMTRKNYPVRNQTYRYSYSGDFIVPGCEIKNYNKTEIQSCFQPKSFNSKRRIYLIGDSRTRVLFRVLSRRYRGGTRIMDTSTHNSLKDGPFYYIWSEHFAYTSNQTRTLGIRSDDFVIVGAHFLHPIYNLYRHRDDARLVMPELPEDKKRKVDMTLMNRFLEIDLDVFRVDTLPFLVETGARILVVSSEGNFDVERQSGVHSVEMGSKWPKTIEKGLKRAKRDKKGQKVPFLAIFGSYILGCSGPLCMGKIFTYISHCGVLWSREEADLMMVVYNEKLREILDSTGLLENGEHSKNESSPRIGFLENNQITSATPDRQLSLYADNIHKIKHAKSQTFTIPDSLRIDSDFVFNYFCNK